MLERQLYILKKLALDHLLPITIFSLLAILLTAPLAWDLYGLCLKGDPYLIIWTLNYETRQLFTNPPDLFDAPIFYPYLRTLALTDVTLGAIPFHLLTVWLTGDPIAAYNIFMIAAYVACGYTAFVLCRFGFSFSWMASLIGGIVFGFCNYRFDHIYHLMIIWTPWVPLALLSLMAYIRKRTWVRVLILGFLTLMQVLSSFYNGMFLITLLLVCWLFLAPPPRLKNLSIYLKPTAIFLLCVVLLVPILINYVLINQELGLRRTYRENIGFSADVGDLLLPSVYAKVFYMNWPVPRIGRFEHGIMLGFAPMAAALLGILAFRRQKKGSAGKPGILIRALNWAIYAYAVIITISIILVLTWEGSRSLIAGVNTWTLTFIVTPILVSLRLWLAAKGQPLKRRALAGILSTLVVSLFLVLGPEVRVGGHFIGYGLYWVLYNFLPFFAAFRVPCRWALLTAFTAAVFAAYGFDTLRNKIGNKTWIALAVLMTCITLYEYSPIPVPYPQTADYDRPEYHWLAEQEGDFAIFEFPIHSNPSFEAEYMVGQIIHGKKLVNGYSGFLVGSTFSFLDKTRIFPDDFSIALMRTFPYRYLLFHKDMLQPDQVERFEALARQRTDLFHEVARFGPTTVYEVNKGATGKLQEFTYPPGEKWISMNWRAAADLTGRQQFIRLEINGKEAFDRPVNKRNEMITFDITKFSEPRMPTELAFYYHYQLSEPVEIPDGETLPFDLLVESGGRDQNYCVVGINGNYFPRDKGYNLYLIETKGDVKDYWNFNTSWYESDSIAMAELLEGLEERQGYLLLVTRYDASRNLHSRTVKSMRSLGLKANLRGKANWNHIALVRLEDSKPLAESFGNDKQILHVGEFLHDAGFIIERMSTSAVPANHFQPVEITAE